MFKFCNNKLFNPISLEIYHVTDAGPNNLMQKMICTTFIKLKMAILATRHTIKKPCYNKSKSQN